MLDLVGSADLLDPPLVEHGDAVTEAHRLDLVMGDVDGGDPHPLLELLQLVTGRRAELGVQVGQRLVEQEHLRLPDQGAGQRDPLALAAGQLPGPAVEQLVNAEPAGCPAHLLRPLLPRYARGREREGDVREHGLVRVQGVALEHHRDLPRPGGQVGDHLPPDEDVALAGVLQARDEPQQRCLAAAGWAEQDEVLALLGLQVNAIHRGDGAELLVQRLGFHHGHGGHLPPWWQGAGGAFTPGPWPATCCKWSRTGSPRTRPPASASPFPAPRWPSWSAGCWCRISPLPPRWPRPGSRRSWSTSRSRPAARACSRGST